MSPPTSKKNTAFILVRGDERALVSRDEKGWTVLAWDEDGQGRRTTVLGPNDEDARAAIWKLLEQGFRNGL
jgi:hypothetical protein